MNPLELQRTYLDLTTPHVADANMRLGIPVQQAPASIRPSSRTALRRPNPHHDRLGWTPNPPPGHQTQQTGTECNRTRRRIVAPDATGGRKPKANGASGTKPLNHQPRPENPNPLRHIDHTTSNDASNAIPRTSTQVRGGVPQPVGADALGGGPGQVPPDATP